MQYQLIRSARRKSVAIQVREQRVVVRAPFFVCEKAIESLVAKKRQWIEQHLKLQMSNQQRHCDFTHGSQIMVRGELKTIQVTYGSKQSVNDSTSFLKVVLVNKTSTSESARIKKQLEKYFRTEANNTLPLKVALFAQLMSTEYTEIRVRKYSARWGSCSSNGVLSFNYLLMMAPEWVVDYVVIHELSHRFHMNHSPDFWRMVAKFCPKYKHAKEWFKTHQSYLHWN